MELWERRAAVWNIGEEGLWYEVLQDRLRDGALMEKIRGTLKGRSFDEEAIRREVGSSAGAPPHYLFESSTPKLANCPNRLMC